MRMPVSTARVRVMHVASSSIGWALDRNALMRPLRAFVGVACSLVFAEASCTQGPVSPYPDRVGPNQAIAFLHVNVVPMDREVVLTNRTVLIRDRKIEWIRESDASIPGDAIRIEGSGRYLMPGLIDAHVHARRSDMALYRAAGITAVRNMWGHDGITQLKTDVESGGLPGPRIVSASPGVDGTPVQWPFTQILEDATLARQLVHRLTSEGWSFIKVYTNLPASAYDSVLAAAHDEGIEVIGHVPVRVSIEHALASGQRSIEHLMGYDRALSASHSNGTFGWADANPAGFAPLVALTAAHGVWNCPTLEIYKKLAEQQGGSARERMIQNRRAFVKQLSDAGAPLLAGTDAGIDVVPAGFTLQGELEELVAAGLTPFRALQAATMRAAAFIRLDKTGTIAEGNRADLVLLSGNPLDNIAATRRIAGAVFGGTWLSAEALAAHVQ